LGWVNLGQSSDSGDQCDVMIDYQITKFDG